MNDQRTTNVEQRMQKMERSLRRTRLGMALAAGVAAASVLAGWGSSDAATDARDPDILKVRRLAVVNSDGQEVAVLSANQVGGGLLRIQDERGRKQLVAGAGKEAGFFRTYHTEGHTLASISASSDGSGMILNYGTNDKPLVTIGASGAVGKESGAVLISNWRNNPIVRMGSTTRFNGYVSTFDEWGKENADLGL